VGELVMGMAVTGMVKVVVIYLINECQREPCSSMGAVFCFSFNISALTISSLSNILWVL